MDTCTDYTVFDDAIGFTNQVLRLNNVVLGIRWMTFKRAGFGNFSYDKIHTDKMFDMLKNAKVDKKKGQPINVFIRGHYANRSRENSMDLYKNLNKTNPVTFTLYTDEQYWFNDTTNMNNPAITKHNTSELREVIEFLGPENVYLQVSDEIRAKLELRGLSNQRPTINSAPSLVQMKFVSLITFIGVKFVGIFVF